MQTALKNLMIGIVVQLAFVGMGYADSISVYPMRGHSSDHTRQFEFRLHRDHKLLVRSLNPLSPKNMESGDLVPRPWATEWHLFDGTGLPYDKDRRPLLSQYEHLNEFSVSSEVIVAVSNFNRVLMYKPTVLERPISWNSQMGAPFKGDLYLPENRRAWTFSCSLRDKPKRNVSFIDPQERVTYYEDGSGVSHDFGHTSTIYVLLGDGQKIVFWDTGLPHSFSRGFLVPEGMQGQDIGAAGSTVLLSALDAQGRLRYFTQMHDYEINGSCPGLPFTFTEVGPSGSCWPGGSVPLGYGLRRLPLEGWREHRTDDLSQATLTSKVSIHLTGRGNSARELRVQAAHGTMGVPGYYYKGIDELSWNFQSYPDLMPHPRFIFPYDPNLPVEFRKNYEGSVLKAPAPGFQIQLNGFHTFNTASEPSYLTISEALSQGGKVAHIQFHTVDGWGYDTHKRYHEELVGKVEGEPKVLQGTIVLNPEQLRCKESAKDSTCGIIRKNFLRYHGQVNAFQLIADNHRVQVKTTDRALQFAFERTLDDDSILNSFYIRWAMQPRLSQPPMNPAHQMSLLTENSAALEEMKSVHRQYRVESLGSLVRTLAPIPVRPVARVLFHAFSKDPRKEKAMTDIKPLLHAQIRVSILDLVRGSKTHTSLYTSAIHIVEERIEQLKAQE